MCMTHKNKILTLFLTTTALLLFLTPTRVWADDTANYPWVRPDGWLAQIISKPGGTVKRGHIGVDVSLGTYPRNYNPCHNTGDSFVVACDSPGGYYKVARYSPTGTNFQYGIFVDSRNNGVTHNWAKRLKTVYLELYPYSVDLGPILDGYRLDPGACNCTVNGGLQVEVSDWKGGYSADIGKLKPPKFGDANITKINGYVTRKGVRVRQNEVNLDWFALDANKSQSSTGYPTKSFASWPTNNDGYYTTGPIVSGRYTVFITDKGPGGAGPTKKIECTGIETSQFDRIDIKLSRPHFGLDAPGRQCFDR